jgi:hypothetical protein
MTISKTSGPDQPLQPADVSQLVAVAMRLAMEVSALRERVATHEALLARHGLLDAAAVDAYVPSAAENVARAASDRELIEALARDIEPAAR